MGIYSALAANVPGMRNASTQEPHGCLRSAADTNANKFNLRQSCGYVFTSWMVWVMLVLPFSFLTGYKCIILLFIYY